MFYVYTKDLGLTIDMIEQAVKEEFPDYNYYSRDNSYYGLNRETGRMEKQTQRQIIIAKSPEIGGLLFISHTGGSLELKPYFPGFNFKVILSIFGIGRKKQTAFRLEILKFVAAKFNTEVRHPYGKQA